MKAFLNKYFNNKNKIVQVIKQNNCHPKTMSIIPQVNTHSHYPLLTTVYISQIAYELKADYELC